MKKKKSRRIAKILASLAIVISLGSVIAWHLMMDAQAHDYSKEDVGGSKHFESGEALIRINGPSGTSELWVKIISNDYNKVWYTKGSGKKKKTYYYKNQSGSDFIATPGHGCISSGVSHWNIIPSFLINFYPIFLFLKLLSFSNTRTIHP